MAIRILVNHRTGGAAPRWVRVAAPPPSREGPSAGQSSPPQARLDPGEGAHAPGLPRDPGADAREPPRHRLRGGGLPQHRRVLVAAPCHHDDHGRDLHPRLLLLQRGHRPAGAARRRRAGAGRCRGGAARVAPRRGDERGPRRPAGRRRRALRAHHPRHPRGRAGHHGRGADPGLPAEGWGAGGCGGGPAGRPQPQSGNGAEASTPPSAPVPATTIRCACSTVRSGSTRRSSPSPA